MLRPETIGSIYIYFSLHIYKVLLRKYTKIIMIEKREDVYQ
jgi:hypothetical protein